MPDRLTFRTKYPPMAQRIRLAHHSGGYILITGDLMEIVTLAEVDDEVVAEMIPALLDPYALLAA